LASTKIGDFPTHLSYSMPEQATSTVGSISGIKQQSNLNL
jgi:hypothetical protein